MNRLEKNREPEVVFVNEKKQKEYPHRPRKEIDMDQYTGGWRRNEST